MLLLIAKKYLAQATIWSGQIFSRNDVIIDRIKYLAQLTFDPGQILSRSNVIIDRIKYLAKITFGLDKYYHKIM